MDHSANISIGNGVNPVAVYADFPEAYTFPGIGNTIKVDALLFGGGFSSA